MLAALLLSILPAAVAYSRLGWDPSDTPAVALLAIGCAMGNRPLLAAGALIVALAVHPTNIFLAPIVAAAWAPFALAHYQRASRRQRQIALVTTIGLVVLPIAIGFMLRESVGPDTSLPSLATVIARVTSPGAWRDLMLGVIRLFSGVTIARYIAGPIGQTPAAIADAITLLAFAVPLVVGWRAFAGNAGKGLWFLAGIAASLVAFHVVAGPEALRPGHERYGMFLLSPLVILLASALAACSIPSAIGRVIGSPTNATNPHG